MSATVGTVSELRRYPVKSMLGEQLARATVTDRGVAGDRAYALVDDETGKVISVKRPNRWGRMFELTATTDGNEVCVLFPTEWPGPSATPNGPGASAPSSAGRSRWRQRRHFGHTRWRMRS